MLKRNMRKWSKEMFGIVVVKMRELENEVDNKECGRDERIRR